MSTITMLADAVVASLNAGTFSLPFTAERGYLPSYNLEEVSGLQVTVVPKSVSIVKASRESAYIDPVIDICVQQKVETGGDLSVTDGLVSLVEEIADHLRGSRLADAPHAVWMSIENDPIYDRDHMERLHVFTSLVSVTYRTRR